MCTTINGCFGFVTIITLQYPCCLNELILDLTSPNMGFNSGKQSLFRKSLGFKYVFTCFPEEGWTEARAFLNQQQKLLSLGLVKGIAVYPKPVDPSLLASPVFSWGCLWLLHQLFFITLKCCVMLRQYILYLWNLQGSNNRILIRQNTGLLPQTIPGAKLYQEPNAGDFFLSLLGTSLNKKPYKNRTQGRGIGIEASQ